MQSIAHEAHEARGDLPRPEVFLLLARLALLLHEV